MKTTKNLKENNSTMHTYTKDEKLTEKRLGNHTFTDKDEAEYYRNKELYDNSGLARHKEAMENAKQACKEKGIDVDETKGVYESKQLIETYSEELGGDPEDFVSDLKDIINKLNEIDTFDLATHLSEELLSNFIDECNNNIKEVTSKYNLKESKTEEEPLNLQPDNTEIKQPKDLIGKYVKIGVNYYPVFDVKSEGDKFVICYGSAGPMVKGGEFEPATIDQIKNLQLYVDTNKKVQESKKLQERDTSKEAILDSVNNKIVPELEWVAEFGKDAGLYGLAELCEEYANTLKNTKIEESDKVDAEKFVKDTDAKKKLDKIDKINKDLDESKKVTKKKDTPELVQKAKDWKKKVTAAEDEDTLEEIVDEIMNEVKDLSETNWAAEDLYYEVGDVMDNQDAADRGPITYIRSVKMNFKNILDDFINNYEDACADAELDEGKKVQESKTLTESDNTDVDVDTDPIIYMNTWKNYNEYGADLTMYGDIEGWMTVEDARNFAEEHEEDEPFINDTDVDLPFEVNEYSNVMDALDNIEEYLNLDEDDRDIIDCIMEVQTGDINEALDTFRQNDYIILSNVSNEYDLGYEYVQDLDFPTNIMTYFDKDKYKEDITEDVLDSYLEDQGLEDVEDEDDFEQYVDSIVNDTLTNIENDPDSYRDTIEKYFDYEYFGSDLTMSGWSICEDKNTAIYIN